MLSIISFVLILGVLVLAHELGHFVTAIKLGVGVEEFGIGFPPKIFSFKRKGIVYSINLLPLGGFVKIKGENGDEVADPKSFVNQKAWKKSLILSAGVIMNFILGFVFLSIGFFIGLPQAVDQNTPTENITERNVVVAEVLAASPADRAGLKLGDKIIDIDGQAIADSEFLYTYIQTHNQQELSLNILRGQENLDIKTKPEIFGENKEPILGISMLDTGIVHYGFWTALWQGLKSTALMTWLILAAFGNLLKDLFTTGHLSPDLSGPVGVAIMSGQVAKLGFIYILNFAAILSLNLAVLNILPIPALDGGRLFFVIIEKIRGKKMGEKIEGILHNSGFVLLMLLILVITWRDFVKYGAQMWQGIMNIF
ncbi:MAG: Membrane-associated zinc metalloprotease [Parcubacteria group bacterium GW2011_GWA2_36_10]|nr:MAG: Membrane-associated zinc metalloprotease [Parcubacteria group bacterium GW2011_GWA2_36_10]